MSNSYNTPELRQALLEQDLVILPIEALKLWAAFLEGKVDLQMLQGFGPEDVLTFRELYTFRTAWQEQQKGKADGEHEDA